MKKILKNYDRAKYKYSSTVFLWSGLLSLWYRSEFIYNTVNIQYCYGYNFVTLPIILSTFNPIKNLCFSFLAKRVRALPTSSQDEKCELQLSEDNRKWKRIQDTKFLSYPKWWQSLISSAMTSRVTRPSYLISYYI